MLTDYKFWYITEDDNGFVEKCAVRFFYGDVTTENEVKGNGEIVPITRYRRTAKLDPKTMNHTKNKTMQRDNGGNDCVVYTPADFGTIKVAELRKFVNKEMRKDKRGNNIPEQL